MTTTPIPNRTLSATTSLLDPTLVKPAIAEAFTKLDPRVQWRNPVMFVVYVGSILTTVLWVQALAGTARARCPCCAHPYTKDHGLFAKPWSGGVRSASAAPSSTGLAVARAARFVN